VAGEQAVQVVEVEQAVLFGAADRGAQAFRREGGGEVEQGAGGGGDRQAVQAGELVGGDAARAVQPDPGRGGAPAERHEHVEVAAGAADHPGGPGTGVAERRAGAAG
jgi:hypothetical protein